MCQLKSIAPKTRTETCFKKPETIKNPDGKITCSNFPCTLLYRAALWVYHKLLPFPNIFFQEVPRQHRDSRGNSRFSLRGRVAIQELKRWGFILFALSPTQQFFAILLPEGMMFRQLAPHLTSFYFISFSPFYLMPSWKITRNIHLHPGAQCTWHCLWRLDWSML